MYWASRVLLLSLVVPLAFSQEAQPPPPATGSVEGFVVKAETQEPLKKAWVTLQRAEGPGKSIGVLTDASGRFALKDIEPGRYRLVTMRNGFVTQGYGESGPESSGTILSVSPGQSIRDIRIALTLAGVVSGRVYDDDGEPVVNAHVRTMKFVYNEGKRELRPVGFGQTNDLGEYRIFGLAPGSYYVSATFEGWGRPPLAGVAGSGGGGSSGDEMGFAPTYYPGTNDLALAAPVEARAGEEVSGLDLNLLSTRAVKIRGRILDSESGKGEPRAWVMLLPRDSKVQFFSPSAQTNVNNPLGEFELRGVVPGSYTLLARTFAGGEVFQARIPLDVGPADIEGLIVLLGKGAEIPGRVRWDGTVPSNKDEKVRVALSPREETITFTSMTSETKPDDTFTLKNIADGDYKVQIWGAPEDCYLKSATLRGVDVLSTGVSISGGRVPGALEITMNCAAGTVQGSVAGEHGNPATGVTVVLVPEIDRRELLHLFKSTTTDQYGRFSIKGVAPGEYKVFAWDRIEAGAYHDPEFLRRFESEGKPVSIGEGSTLELQVELILAGKSQR